MEQMFNKFQTHLDPDGRTVNVVFIKKINKFNNQVKMLVEDVHGVKDTLPTTNLALAKNKFVEGDALVLKDGAVIKVDKVTALSTYPPVTQQDVLEEQVYVFSNTGYMSDEIVRLSAIPSEYVVLTFSSNEQVHPEVKLDPGNYRYVVVKASKVNHTEIHKRCTKVDSFITVIVEKMIVDSVKTR